MKTRSLLLTWFCLSALVVSLSAGVVPVSVVSNAPSVSAAGNSFAPVLTSDGARVFFVSHAPNLRSNEVRHDALQIFMRDLVSGITTLLSATTNGTPAGADMSHFTVSSNGQSMLLRTEANGLVRADVNNLPDIFVRNVVAGTNRLVTVNRYGAPLSQGLGTNTTMPLMSADGRYVFFESTATDLTQEMEQDFNNAADVYRRDLQSNVTVLVSSGWQPPYAPPGDAGSALRSITPDGRKVVFSSRGWGIYPGIFTGNAELYVRDMNSRTIWRVSFTPTNGLSEYSFPQAVISDNGRYVVFIVYSPYGWPVQSTLYLRDLETSALTQLATNVSSFQMSWDARYVLTEDGTNIYRLDTTTLSNELVNVTVTNTAPTNGAARSAVLSSDGRYVAFLSDMAGLTTNAVSGWQLYARDMTTGVARLLTVASNGQPSSEQSPATLYSMTPDLSRVAFDSTASDLVPGDNNAASDVFLREVTNGVTTLISTAASGGPRQTGRAHGWLNDQSLSADGRFLVFTSYDSDWLPGDTNRCADVFLRDLVAGSVNTPGFSTNAAGAATISADGRYIVYLRYSPVWAWDSINTAVYRYDRQTGMEELVTDKSTSTRPTISSNGQWIAWLSQTGLVARNMNVGSNWNVGTAQAHAGRDAQFTPDGSRLLFVSTASLTPNAPAGQRSLYAWHTASRTNALLSQDGGSAFDVLGPFSVSGNSRFVAFYSGNYNMLFRRDLLTGTNLILRSGAWQPALNHDGAVVACTTRGSFPDRLLFFHANTGEELYLRTNSGPFNTPLFSADGRFVVYARRTFKDLGSHVEYSFQLSAFDRLLRTTTLISASLDGTNANGSSSTAAFGVHGRTVVFHSVASDLIPGDSNDKLDLFSFQLGGGDVDGDGLDDDWEVTYFGNLARDGSGDYDGDGVIDRAEFLSSTDPTNTGSVFRVVRLTSIDSATRQLVWQGNPTRDYRVEYKEELNAPNWKPLYVIANWYGSNAVAFDYPPPSATNRYYRVVVLP